MPEEQQVTPSPQLTKTQRASKALPAVLIFLSGVTIALIAVLLYGQFQDRQQPLTAAEVNQIVVDTMGTATPPPAYSAQIYNYILPSIVYIKTQRDLPDTQFDTGIGTGVVINDMGNILTALHVVENSEEITVIFADGTESIAEIVNSDPANDIAVLEADQLPGLLVPAVIGSLDGMRVGDEAYAIGNPLGLSASMSAGIISGFDRSIPFKDKDQVMEGLIQFDTAVNPGNSGGPLINRAGQVIGIVTALANPSEQNTFIGIGFAIPIGTAGSAANAPQY